MWSNLTQEVESCAARYLHYRHTQAAQGLLPHVDGVGEYRLPLSHRDDRRPLIAAKELRPDKRYIPEFDAIQEVQGIL